MNNFYKLRLSQIILTTILNTTSVTYAQQTEVVCDNKLAQALVKFGENSDDTEIKRRSLEMKQSCEEEQKAKQKAAESLENLEIWKEMKREISKLPDKDMYQEVLERSVKELKLHPHDVSKMMEKDDPKIRAVFDRMIKEENQKLFNEIKAKRIAQRKLQDKGSNKQRENEK